MSIYIYTDSYSVYIRLGIVYIGKRVFCDVVAKEAKKDENEIRFKRT